MLRINARDRIINEKIRKLTKVEDVIEKIVKAKRRQKKDLQTILKRLKKIDYRQHKTEQRGREKRKHKFKGGQLNVERERKRTQRESFGLVLYRAKMFLTLGLNLIKTSFGCIETVFQQLAKIHMLFLSDDLIHN